MIKPLISIIMPVYNSDAFLEDTIKCVLKQTYQNWELVIVNDGSTDNSQKIINAYKTEKVISIQRENKGLATTRNDAIRAAKGDYFALLDSDDLWAERKLEQQLQSMIENDSDLSFTEFKEFSDVQKFDKGDKIYNQEASENIEKDLFDAIITQKIIPAPSSVMFPRRIIDKVLFCETFRYVEDLDFYLQIYKAGFRKFHVINECLTYHRMHENNLSSNKEKMIDGLMNAYDRYFSNESDPLYLIRDKYYEKRIMSSIKSFYKEKNYKTFLMLYEKLKNFKSFWEIQFILHIRAMRAKMVLYFGQLKN